MKTDKELYDFCKGHYYCCDADGEDCLWEPFENYPKEDIEKYIQDDICSLKRFMEDE